MRGLAVNVAFKGILNPLSHAVSSIQPAQELRPEIGSSGADGSKQFRVICYLKKGPLDFRWPFSELAVFS